MNDFNSTADVISRTVSQRGSTPEHGGMIDHGLDVAIIGNGRTAALVDP
jgi:hypothetical protein